MSDTIMQIEIENLKCGGCANTIVRGLSEIEGVTSVTVDRALHRVRLQSDEAARPAILERLLGMGYPEKGRAGGPGATVAGAKSLVSRAVGQVT